MSFPTVMPLIYYGVEKKNFVVKIQQPPVAKIQQGVIYKFIT